MSETKWTPGPWAQSHRQSGTVYRTEVYDAKGETIAVLAWHAKPTTHECVTTTDQAANAQLIAAAPDVYAALDRLVETTARSALARGEESMAVRVARIHATAALALARGEA